MARINLLPWRETARKRRKKEFAVIAASASGLMLLAGLLLHLHLESLISRQEGRNAFLQQEIRRLEAQIEELAGLEKAKDRLLARVGVLQRLQQSRLEVVHLFDELTSAVPAGLYLTKMDQSEHHILLEGRARSDARISDLMRNIEASPWIDQPLLLLIEHKDKTGAGWSHFRLQLRQVQGFGGIDETRGPAGDPGGNGNVHRTTQRARPR